MNAVFCDRRPAHLVENETHDNNDENEASRRFHGPESTVMQQYYIILAGSLEK